MMNKLALNTHFWHKLLVVLRVASFLAHKPLDFHARIFSVSPGLFKVS